MSYSHFLHYRYCGGSMPSFTKTSQTDSIVVLFRGEYGDSRYYGNGFQLCYKLVDGKYNNPVFVLHTVTYKEGNMLLMVDSVTYFSNNMAVQCVNIPIGQQKLVNAVNVYM